MRNQDTILGSNKNHKGAATPICLTVEGVATVLHPLAQDRVQRSLLHIKGKAWGVSLTKEADFSTTLGEAWYAQGCTNSVKVLAYQKVETNPGLNVYNAIRSALWQVLFNQPSKLFIHAYRYTDEVQSIIKYCLSNAINVQFVDMYTERVWEFQAQANDIMHPLYQVFRIPASTPNHGAIKIAYEKALKRVEDKKWNNINRELAEISAVYFMDKKETMYERITMAKRAELREYLDSIGYTAEIGTFIREDYPQLASVVEKYGRAFGYDLKTRETEIQKNQFRSQVTYKEEARKYGINQAYARNVAPTEIVIPQLRENNVYDGGQVEFFWDERNQTNHMQIDLSYFSVAATQKYLAEAQPEYLEVTKAALAINWMLENGFQAELSDDDTMLCPNCTHSVTTNFLANDTAVCHYCDTELTLEDLEAFKANR